MTTKTVIHSNAFNFMSFVQNSVDPRTGQYTLAIALPELVGNDLNGPQLPLRLAFNPFHDRDAGFGKGWDLALTQYVPSSKMLTLHSGESFKVTGSGALPSIREKKLDSFHFHDDSAGSTLRYRVVHKSGLVEQLTPFGAGSGTVALPTRVHAPSGHGITLGYTPYQGNICLDSIVDDSGLALLKITYGLGQVTLDLHPGAGPHGAAYARYTLQLSNGQLRQVTLPTDDGASWRFEYITARSLTCLAKVSTPTGGIERILYEDDGHPIPTGGARGVLPRVTTHEVMPGFGQPPLKTTYTYSVENFVGNNSGITWTDNGEDNLYRARASYEYVSTASHWLDSKVARTVERRYNRFHLLTRETTRQAGHVQESITTYHGEASDAFDAQPANFQLPLTQVQKWSLAADASKLRSETVTTRYDLHGNLLEEVQKSGLRTVHEYYPAETDPEHFVRNRMTETVIPASGGDAPSPTLRTRFEYQALETVAGSVSANSWLVPTKETLLEVVGEAEQPALQVTTLTPIDASDDLLRHGRPLQQVLDIGGNQTRTDFVYGKEVRNGHPVLVTEQTLTGFDHGRKEADGSSRHALKVTTLEHSILIGEPLLTRDDNDVEIAYAYDALRRVVSETVSPNDERFKASRHYTYHLVNSDGQQATQSMVDVKGVETRSLLDGLNRVVKEERHDADARQASRKKTFRERYRASYDGLGQLIQETEYDWLGDEQKPLTTQYAYDDWGLRTSETGPDRVKHFQVTDPIGTAASGNLPIQTRWSESADGMHKLGETITWLNLFDQPAQVQRLDLGKRVVSKHQYFYDGLGRGVREIDAVNAVTRSSYDAFGRLVDQTQADGSVVHRDYAPHSSDDLPVRIGVRGRSQRSARRTVKLADTLHDVVLGEQAFDGLGRMISSTTGGRKRVMAYSPGQRQPSKVITASNQEIAYEYLPQLGEEPLQRRIPGTQADYTYDALNARLLSCTEEHQVLERDYFSTGEVRTEIREVSGERWEMAYAYSLQGRLLSYRDVLDQEQTYVYDAAGRLETTALGSTRSTFSYDGLGNIERIETQDGDQKLITKLGYDDLGREVRRTFVFSDSVQELRQEYTALDQLKRRHLVEGEGEDAPTLRDETYEYDKRGRLEFYTCEGDQAPVDPYGKTIREQVFEFDALDNITWVLTVFDGANGKLEDNEAYYLFDNLDPAQLSGIENTHADYPDSIELVYDLDGNLIQDEQGRALSYDPLGRLLSVTPVDGTPGARYGYDPLDRLASQEA